LVLGSTAAAAAAALGLGLRVKEGIGPRLSGMNSSAFSAASMDGIIAISSSSSSSSSGISTTVGDLVVEPRTSLDRSYWTLFVFVDLPFVLFDDCDGVYE